MADFTDKIPDEYLNDDYDFGFTTVDENEYLAYEEGQTTTPPISSVDTEELSGNISSLLDSRFDALEEKVTALENADTSHKHDNEHGHTKMLVNEKEIELLQVQIEEIKVSTSNPLSQ